MCNHRTVLWTLLCLYLSAPARAGERPLGCHELLDGINGKMKEYRAHRDVLNKTRAKYDGRVASCRANGEDISRRLQEAAAGLSCVAQNDVSALDRKIHDLGQDCEGAFRDIHRMQGRLKDSFDNAKKDLDDSMQLIHDNDVYAEDCPDDVHLAKVMVDAFVAQEGRIVQLGTDADKAAGDNGNLQGAAGVLAVATARLARDCGAGPGSATQLSEAGLKAKGESEGVPGGMSPETGSGITGVGEAQAKARETESVLEGASGQ